MVQNNIATALAGVAGLLAFAGAAQACERCLDPNHAYPAFIPSAAPAVLPAVAAAPIAPAYSSLPGANATLFLDLDGITYPGTWGNKTPGTVPAYDIDNNPGVFSSTELSNIRQIWSRVAETYSPFNINVTTVDPGSLGQRQVTRIVIGGDNSWYGSAGGVAYVGGFAGTGTQNHTGWVFQKNVGSPFNIASAASHEAGHTFGLSHQSEFGADGTFLSEYRRSTDGGYTAPIMGVGYQGSTANLPRNLWSNGPRAVGSNDQASQQLDLGVLASTSGNRSPNGGSYYNGFGFRADDHADSFADASGFNFGNDAAGGLSASGIITQSTDRDFFKFSSTGGSVSIKADGAEFGQMLDILLEVYNSSQSLIGRVDPSVSLSASQGFGLDATFNGILAAGEYFVDVTSHGGYGDIGQYTLNVTGAVAVPEPAALALIGLGGLSLLRRRRA